MSPPPLREPFGCLGCDQLLQIGGYSITAKETQASVQPTVLGERGELVVPYVPSTANLADFFTKPLKPAPFFEMRAKIMNIPS